MQVIVNGEPVELDKPVTVGELLGRYGLVPARVAVEVNQRIVPRADYGRTVLDDGNQIEIVQFVGGG
ncbi:MAG: sulfur carrier protein ThiS [Deltaproteobacteria bacterium]|nr:sulfur carrier protein ThiS [Deltaproteobacteria bacterium]